MLRIHTWCNTTGHWSTTEVTSHFLRAAFQCGPRQPAEPVRLRVWSECEAWHGQSTTQWTWKARQTLRHCLAHTYSRKQTFAQTFCFNVPDSPANTKLTIHTLQPPAALHLLWLLFLSIMEERKVPVQDCLRHPCRHVFLKVPTNLSDKIHGGATFKEEEEERSGLNNESVQGMNHSPGVCLSFLGKK